MVSLTVDTEQKHQRKKKKSITLWQRILNYWIAAVIVLFLAWLTKLLIVALIK